MSAQIPSILASLVDCFHRVKVPLFFMYMYTEIGRIQNQNVTEICTDGTICIDTGIWMQKRPDIHHTLFDNI